MSQSSHLADAATIFALSSGHGRAGVAVFRVSGPRAGTALVALAGGLPRPRRATVRVFRDPGTGEALDSGLALWFPAPASFTGEDVAELHVHGGRAVVRAVAEALARLPGLRPAEAGEFARRAFEHGRLDLTEIEGLADLVNADTDAQRRQALRQSRGALSALYEDWRARLVQAVALMEAALDFADEGDVPIAVGARARPIVEELERALAAHLGDSHRGERLRDGLHVVLAGPPNVGKSSLLNALARRQAAIVSAEAGTTRDVIEVHLDLAGYPVLIMDTAGLREAVGAVETEGMRRTLERADDADVVLWLVDAERPAWEAWPDLTDPTGAPGRLVAVLNKVDLCRPEPPVNDVLTVSAKTGEGVDRLVALLAARAEAALDTRQAPALTRARHRVELEAALDALRRFLEGPGAEPELRAEDLRQAARSLARLTGRVDVDDVLDRIFADFCIGK